MSYVSPAVRTTTTFLFTSAILLNEAVLSPGSERCDRSSLSEEGSSPCRESPHLLSSPKLESLSQGARCGRIRRAVQCRPLEISNESCKPCRLQMRGVGVQVSHDAASHRSRAGRRRKGAHRHPRRHKIVIVLRVGNKIAGPAPLRNDLPPVIHVASFSPMKGDLLVCPD